MPVLALIAHLVACSSEGTGSGERASAPKPSASLPLPVIDASAAPDASTRPDAGDTTVFFDGYRLMTDTLPADALDRPLYRDAELVAPSTWSYVCPPSSEAEVRGSALVPFLAALVAYRDASCNPSADDFTVTGCTATTAGSFAAMRPQVNPSYGTRVAAALLTDPIRILGEARFYAADLNLPDGAITLPADATRCRIARGADHVCPTGYPVLEPLAVVDVDDRSAQCNATVTQTQIRAEVHATNDCSGATLAIPLEPTQCLATGSSNVRSVNLLVHTTTTIAPTPQITGGLRKAYFTACCRSE